MKRARWNGPGSLSTPSGAAGAGSEIDAEFLDESYLAELTRSGALVLLDVPVTACAEPAIENIETDAVSAIASTASAEPEAPAVVEKPNRKRRTK